MSKGLAKAAMIVGAIGLIATGIGSAAGAGLFGAAAKAAVAAGVGTFSTISTIGTIASLTAGLMGVASALTSRKPGPARSTFSPFPLETMP